MTSEQALVNHLLSQIEQNVQFLASQNYISQDDASVILGRLTPANAASPRGVAPANPSGISQITNKFSNMMGSVRGTPPVPAPAPRAVPAAPKVQQARALWGYNEDGSVSHSSDWLFSVLLTFSFVVPLGS
jgi:LAS seventeen-binding protein 1/2